MTTAAETFSLDTLFTATVNGTAYAIVSDEYNSFVVPAAALEQDVDDDGEEAYTAWCEAARVGDDIQARMYELSAAVDAVWDAACAARWLARSAARHYLVTVG